MIASRKRSSIIAADYIMRLNVPNCVELLREGFAIFTRGIQKKKKSLPLSMGAVEAIRTAKREMKAEMNRDPIFCCDNHFHSHTLSPLSLMARDDHSVSRTTAIITVSALCPSPCPVLSLQ